MGRVSNRLSSVTRGLLVFRQEQARWEASVVRRDGDEDDDGGEWGDGEANKQPARSGRHVAL